MLSTKPILAEEAIFNHPDLTSPVSPPSQRTSHPKKEKTALIAHTGASAQPSILEKREAGMPGGI